MKREITISELPVCSHMLEADEILVPIFKYRNEQYSEPIYEMSIQEMANEITKAVLKDNRVTMVQNAKGIQFIKNETNN